jgi:integrase
MLQWIDPETGARKSKSAKTSDVQEAERARADLEYELSHGQYQEASRMTWERFRELFEAEYLPNLRPGTRKRYAHTLDLFEQLSRPARLRSVGERTVSAFAAALRQKDTSGRAGLNASTIRVTLQYLRTALNWAADQKLIPACPRFPAVKVPRKRPQPVPAESFERLLDKAPNDNTRAFLLCGWLAGLRLSEAAALEWAEVEKAPYLDLVLDRIILPAAIVKSVEDQWVPLDPALRQALEALPRLGRKVFQFTAKDGHPLTISGVSERVTRLAKQAGVRMGMHSCRKGFGCRYAAKVSAHVLQRLMRHQSIAVTMTYYANIDAAVEAAVFGPERNTKCNRERMVKDHTETPSDVNP